MCEEPQTQCIEPLVPNKLPDLLWQRVAVDFLDIRSHMYLLLVNYYSRYVEIVLLAYHFAPYEIGSAQPLFVLQLHITLSLIPEQHQLKLLELSHMVGKDEHLPQWH